MAGLFGFSGGRRGRFLSDDLLKSAGRLIHSPEEALDSVFEDEFLLAGCVRRPSGSDSRGLLARDDVLVWADGEIFGGEQSLRKETGQVHRPRSTENLMLDLYLENGDFDFLKQINGIFAAIVYDRNHRKLYVISDRYGFRPLYFVHTIDGFGWASEMKFFLNFLRSGLRIDQKAVEQFFSVGHLLGRRTWFEEVELFPSATVVKIDLRSGVIEDEHRYWWWDRIRPTSGRIDMVELADELGRLLEKSVIRRCADLSEVGILLSGGLDSRAILAATPLDGSAITTLTFGKAESYDIKYARQAANMKKTKHRTVFIDENNWLSQRFSGVWRTDGQLNLLHMHGSEMLEGDVEFPRSQISGFLGDAVAGGSYLSKHDLGGPVTQGALVRRYNLKKKITERLDDYTRLKTVDFYHIDNRARRFVLCGLKLIEPRIQSRLPFFDNELVEFVYSLPDSLRYGSRLYNRALLRRYPEFFKGIPWARTGAPISYPQWLASSQRVARAIYLGSCGRIVGRNSTSYTDYPNWLRKEPATTVLERLLLSREALYPDYVERQDVYKRLDEHMKGSNHVDFLCLTLTFELWLQQCFRGKFTRGFED